MATLVSVIIREDPLCHFHPKLLNEVHGSVPFILSTAFDKIPCSGAFRILLERYGIYLAVTVYITERLQEVIQNADSPPVPGIG